MGRDGGIECQQTKPKASPRDRAESVTEVNGDQAVDTPKNHEAPIVPIPKSMVRALGKLTKGKAPDDREVSARQSGVLRVRNFRRDVLTPAARAIGVAGLTPHELRHAAANLVIAAGADVKVVRQMLGHKTATMTLDLDGRLFSDRLDLVAGKMAEARALALAA